MPKKTKEVVHKRKVKKITMPKLSKKELKELEDLYEGDEEVYEGDEESEDYEEKKPKRKTEKKTTKGKKKTTKKVKKTKRQTRKVEKKKIEDIEDESEDEKPRRRRKEKIHKDMKDFITNEKEEEDNEMSEEEEFNEEENDVNESIEEDNEKAENIHEKEADFYDQSSEVEFNEQFNEEEEEEDEGMKEVKNENEEKKDEMKKPKKNVEKEQQLNKRRNSYLYLNGFEENERKEYFNKFRELKIIVTEKIEKATHLINKKGLAPNSKLYFGICKGCWILKEEFLNHIIEKKILIDEEKFENEEFAACKEQRIERKPVFNNTGIYITRFKNKDMTRTEFNQLMNLTGFIKVENERQTKICVGDRKDEISVQWVYDCILQNKILPFETYLNKE